MLLHPVIVYGLFMGVISLVIALLIRSRAATSVALFLICLAAATAWPTYHYGEAGYDRVRAMADSAGEKWLDQHKARAEKLITLFYILAGVALAALIVPLKWPTSSLPLAIITLLLGMGTLGVGGWISYPGGHVRHKEFRFEPPPQPAKIP